MEKELKELCWCGSGEKYRDCHFNRENQKSVNRWDFEKNLKKTFSEKDCMAPDKMKDSCSNQIIKAHTISKSGSLSKISQSGKVYGYKPSFNEFKKMDYFWEPSLIGIQKASTFTGFCSKHDNDIFSPLEHSPFTATEEQCFLLGYRSTCRALYVKIAQNDENLYKKEKEIDRGKTFLEQIFIQKYIDDRKKGIESILEITSIIKKEYDDILINRSFNRTSSYILELSKPTPVMCSGTFFPTEDFNGQSIKYSSRYPELLTLNSFASEKKDTLFLHG